MRKGKSLYATTSNSFGTGEAVTITPNDVSGLPTGNLVLTFDRSVAGKIERIKGTISGSNFVVASGGRGYDGTTEQAHTSPTVEYIYNGADQNDAVDAFKAEHSVAGVHDATKVAMIAGTQTVTGAKSFDLQLGLKGISAPASPSAGYLSLYAGTDDKVYKKTSAGVVSELGTGGSQSETFIIPGTLATGTDLAKTWVMPFNAKITSATPYVKTAGTTNATTFDINIGGTTNFTTKLSIASGATSGSNQASDTPTATTNAGSLITIDVDSVSTTAPVEAYIVLFYERV